MKRIELTIIATLLLLMAPLGLSAQRLFRSDMVTYSMRADSDSNTPSDSTKHIRFQPTISKVVHKPAPHIAVSQLLSLPLEWSDGATFLHLENIGMAYTLNVNSREVGGCNDPYTPAEYELSNYLKQGINIVTVALVGSPNELENGIKVLDRPSLSRFEGSYYYTHHRRRIIDFEASIRPDSTYQYGVLNVAAVVENGYNYPESIEVGFDIYSPEGKLLRYASRAITLDGGARDTVRFTTDIYHANGNRWSPSNPALYNLTLLTKRDGMVSSYTPRKVALLDRIYYDGVLYNFDEADTLRAVRYNATSTKELAQRKLTELKKQGYNTIRPNYSQPRWLYELCDQMGLYVIEQININAPQRADQRGIAGSPSNDPALVGEYLERAKASYYRTRNYPSVIAYSLGEESGNGYNMYKMYQWLKSVESSRPIIYDGAQGEWNSDKLNIQ